ncbi:AFG1-like ATPase-domain-containing protein [Coniochaeta sp. 2T2.1]|nr:AFG1-like ATPase-domain-containing protein [Coniochaeta sp. 2T2.1]
MSRLPQVSSSLTITDPLIKYQSLLATGVLSPSPNQHRLAHHLQKLYRDLKDYSPQTEYRARLSLLTQAIDSASAHPKPSPSESSTLAVPSHPIWRNPFFARLLTAGGQGRGKGRSLALTRVLTSRQAAVEIDSPRGLFLSGDVGTGKSMLLDLLAEGLPTGKKRRWHFSGFMLYALSRLEHFRKISEGKGGGEGGGGGGEGEYSLLWLGKEMIETSPILFLDEFQLPDRAASKILGNLFVVFFQLGGVLVASSNRMPEELERATGEYGETERGVVARVLGMAGRRKKVKGRGELYGTTSDFAGFLEVLKARCEFWHMEGRDWRRWEGVEVGIGEGKALVGDGVEGVGEVEKKVEENSEGALRPAKYFIGMEETEEWRALVSGAWQSARLVVYGRSVLVPRQRDGVSLWDFSELVHSFGPADCITLASNYHTFIIDRVPILPLSMKNEARRFITFLDALYESRCKLIIRAAAGTDDLFFPETRRAASVSNSTAAATEPHTDGGGDAVYSETIAEVFQDQTSPFRPNISSYNPDQDSDFGTEQDPSKKVDFTDAGAFTGQDERFAYARAESRLWEMCGARWHAREGEGWWMPLPAEARHWEGREISRPLRIDTRESVRVEIAKGDVSFGPVVELDGPVGLEGRNVTELRRREEERRAAGAEGS